MGRELKLTQEEFRWFVRGRYPPLIECPDSVVDDIMKNHGFVMGEDGFIEHAGGPFALINFVVDQ